MKYFRITDWFDQPGRWHLGSPKTRNGIELDARLFTEGNEYRGEITYPPSSERRMKDYRLEIPFEMPICEGSNPLEFTLGPFDIPILTERIAEHLEVCCRDAIQLIPVRITGIDPGFEILNAIKRVDAVDREKSEISWRTKKDAFGNKVQTFAGISRLVLKEREIADARIFRLRGWELPLIVDESVKTVLENLRTTGIKFDEVRTA